MQIKKLYQEHKRRNLKKVWGMTVAVLVVFLFCLTFRTGLNFFEGAAAVGRYVVFHDFSGIDAAADKVILFLRLPRLCLTILAGMGLSVAGMMMQSVTRNFLVSPFTLGVSSAAAFGASVCIVFGSATIFFHDVWIISSAFVASMLSMLVILGITRAVGATANSVILVGIAMNYFFAALTAALQFFAQENKLAAVVQWTFGTFNRANWNAVLIVGLVLLLCFMCASRLVLRWNVMASSNDELVESLGVSPERLRRLTMFLSVLITSAIISFTGVIGFVGLIAPHMARMLVGNDHAFLFPMSAAIGAVLLILADALGQFLLYPVNVPAGIIVSFIGVPIFVQLILSSRKRRME